MAEVPPVEVQPQQAIIDNGYIFTFRGPGNSSRPSIFHMKKTFLCVFLLFLFVPFLYAGNNDGEIAKVLFSAESLFKAMKEKNYPQIWTFLSVRSKSIIVDDVAKAEEKMGKKYTKEDIGKDFTAGSLLSRLYWNSYLENFNPDSVLKESKWEMGKIEKNRAEIIALHRKSQAPARLQMFNEEGRWVVGLEETFRSSRR